MSLLWMIVIPILRRVVLYGGFVLLIFKEVDPEEERLMSLFMNNNQEHRTLGDIIMEKMQQRELLLRNPDAAESTLDPKVMKVYSKYFWGCR